MTQHLASIQSTWLGTNARNNLSTTEILQLVLHILSLLSSYHM
jgi:hypothetical protein